MAATTVIQPLIQFPSTLSLDYTDTPQDQHSFPTRRSSDLDNLGLPKLIIDYTKRAIQEPNGIFVVTGPTGSDRKSTRLNSSHVSISHAVFCLKKKIGDIERRYCVAR